MREPIEAEERALADRGCFLPAAELEAALLQQSWDLVLADVGDSELLRTRLAGDAAPTILPVLYQPTRAVYADVKKDYGSALKAPFKGRRLLETVDDAVAMRAE